jgi:hypothetical protein
MADDSPGGYYVRQFFLAGRILVVPLGRELSSAIYLPLDS